MSYAIPLVEFGQYWFRQKLLAFTSLAPGNFEWNFRHVIFKQILVIDGWGIPCEIALIWMSLDFTDYQSTLVQVMAWCRQATSHCLIQCWPRFMSPYGVTRPQWVKEPSNYRCWLIDSKEQTLVKSKFKIFHFIEWLQTCCLQNYILFGEANKDHLVSTQPMRDNVIM